MTSTTLVRVYRSGNSQAVRLPRDLAWLPVLPLPVEAAAIGGKMRADLQRKGTSLADMDSLIAAHALTVGLVLVTNDAAFHRVSGLTVEDWAEQP